MKKKLLRFKLDQSVQFRLCLWGEKKTGPRAGRGHESDEAELLGSQQRATIQFGRAEEKKKVDAQDGKQGSSVHMDGL